MIGNIIAAIFIGIIGSIIGTMIVLLIWRAIAGRRGGTPANRPV